MTSLTIASAPSGHYRFRNVALMEWIKLRSLRSTFWLVAITAIGTIGIGVAALGNYRSRLPLPSSAQMVNDGLAGAALGQLLIGFLGVLVATNEYSSGMVRATLVAVPNRRLMFAAKATVFGVFAVLVGELTCLVTFFASQAALLGSPVPRASLTDPGVLRTVLLTGAYLGLIGVIGFGLGIIIRHTGPTIAALYGLLFVPLFILVALGSIGADIVKYLPFFILINSVSVLSPAAHSLTAWAGTGVLCLYAAIALGVGSWLLVARDA